VMYGKNWGEDRLFSSELCENEALAAGCDVENQVS
jgi:hypothetical protein